MTLLIPYGAKLRNKITLITYVSNNKQCMVERDISRNYFPPAYPTRALFRIKYHNRQFSVCSERARSVHRDTELPSNSWQLIRDYCFAVYPVKVLYASQRVRVQVEML